MKIATIAHYASTKHGMLDCSPVGGKDHFGYKAEELAAMTAGETGEWLSYMVDHGYLELRTRTVDLDKGPGGSYGNWPAMQPHGETTIRTWHLTESGREAWLANDW